MQSSKLERPAPLSGTLFAVVVAVGILTGGETPDAGERRSAGRPS